MVIIHGGGWPAIDNCLKIMQACFLQTAEFSLSKSMSPSNRGWRRRQIGKCRVSSELVSSSAGARSCPFVMILSSITTRSFLSGSLNTRIFSVLLNHRFPLSSFTGELSGSQA